MKQLFQKLGPGLLYAASAVGTSHLVQSTRAGADYSFGLVFFFIFVVVLKYPGIRFGKDYAQATGLNLIHSYAGLGRFVVGVYTVIIVITMIFVTAALALVTSAILKASLPVLQDIKMIPVILISITVLLLVSGRYLLLERINKAIVPLFTALIIIVTVLTIFQTDWSGQSFAIPEMNAATIMYFVAIAGWLLTPMDASVLLSLWTAEKAKLKTVSPQEAMFDFNLGYWGSLGLSLCFVLLGASVLYGSGLDLPESGGAFATEIISIFSSRLGNWAFPVIAIIAFSIMYSTLMTVMDGYARNVQTLLDIGFPHFTKNGFVWGVVLVGVGASIILLFLMKSFTTFIDLVGALVFILGPIYGWLNHRAVFGAEMPRDARPSQLMRYWSLVGIIVMSIVAILYIYLRLLSY